MSGLNFTVKGDLEMNRKLRAMAKKAPLQFAFAAYEEMVIERNEMEQRTPVATGNLRDSLTVSQPVIRGNDILVSVYTDVDYAPMVHEDLEAHHDVGEAKFMESVLRESQPHMAERIAKRIDLNRLARESS